MSEIYLSGRELGECIDKPVRTIENWAAAGKIEQDEKGKYGLISAFKYQLATIAEKLERTESKLAESEADKDEVKKMAAQRKLIAEADKEEAIAAIKQLELLKLRGELVDTESVDLVLSDRVSKARAKFINIPAKMALELSGLQPSAIQARLTTVIYEALIELGSG